MDVHYFKSPTIFPMQGTIINPEPHQVLIVSSLMHWELRLLLHITDHTTSSKQTENATSQTKKGKKQL